jgi:pyruvate,orthophosphate dikinase
MAKTKGVKRTYSFGSGRAEGDRDMKELLGGKGAGLAEMSRIGIPVPPGFTITTEVCTAFYAAGKRLPRGFEQEMRAALSKVEALTGKGFGDAANPLLVSVRSGARVSMPGMMDTVLNLGLNERTVEGLARRSGNDRFAWDSYRRFCAMFGDVVLGMKPERKEDRDPFEELLEAKKKARGVALDSELSVEALRELVTEFKAVIRERRKLELPDDPFEQLRMAVSAVFQSWENDRADAYRKLNGIPSSWGTAVTVQSMVFGNLGEDSGTGVAFTRNAATGENEFYGEFLVNAQGEDVVAGTRTPQRIGEMAGRWPEMARQLEKVRTRLERHYRDMQDIEFTIERGRLYVLQTRNGKRTGLAAVRIAVEMADEKIISREEAVLRVEPESLNHVLRPIFDIAAKEAAIRAGRLLAKGLPAGPGAACGRVVLFAEDAVEWKARGETVILARHETSPEDIRGMNASDGFLTAFGGMTSHAALVARQMGKVAVVGCPVLSFDYQARTMTVATAQGPRGVREGDWISVDGLLGEVIEGKIPTQSSEVVGVLIDKTVKAAAAPMYRLFTRLLGWADGVRRLKVRANADQPDQARTAIAFGAQGIGLCRTEHMFFGEGKIGPMREMIVAENEAERRTALAKLLPLQREDFAGLFRAMGSRPVTIRTIDPPLHEFLPQDPAGQEELAHATGRTLAQVQARIAELVESNPMLGNRGCRLGISYPEITEMQARAIFEAACEVAAEGVKPQPEVMIPLVGHRKELANQAKLDHEVAVRVFAERKRKVKYSVGTMIEVPRGALTAGEIARTAEFFSFGTNDLTQTTFGISRDDVGTVLNTYVQKEIYSVDPFVTIDRDGVGVLMKTAIAAGRATRPGMKIGICGEHGGDPNSVEFCDAIGLDYVSCSPYRLPIARLAAAQAVLKQRNAGRAKAKKAAKKKVARR